MSRPTKSALFNAAMTLAGDHPDVTLLVGLKKQADGSFTHRMQILGISLAREDRAEMLVQLAEELLAKALELDPSLGEAEPTEATITINAPSPKGPAS